jgi:hypothetical protein
MHRLRRHYFLPATQPSPYAEAASEETAITVVAKMATVTERTMRLISCILFHIPADGIERYQWIYRRYLTAMGMPGEPEAPLTGTGTKI